MILLDLESVLDTPADTHEGPNQTAFDNVVSRSSSSDASVSSGAASSAANWEILLALAIGAVMPG